MGSCWLITALFNTVNEVWLLVFTGKREESLNKYNSALTELPPIK